MTTKRFTATARVLHWTMALLILAMLFLGVGMVTSNARYGLLVAIHRPVGITILVLAGVRLIYRLLHPPPPLPEAMPDTLKSLAHATQWVLYALMFAVPLAGWGMLSAGAYPVTLFGAVRMPPIAPHDRMLYAHLRTAHTALAFSLFVVLLFHIGPALLHAFLFKDGVFESMATLKKDDNRDNGLDRGLSR